MELSGEVAAAIGIVAVGATVQGSVGFGMALLAAPMLALIDPAYVPGPVMIAGLSLTLMVAVRERARVDLPAVSWALGGRVVGTGLAVVVLVSVSKSMLSILFAGLVLLAVGLTASGLRVDPRPRTLAAAGVVSGVMGTITSIGGPPIALLFQHADGPVLRGTMAGYFTVSVSLSLLALRLAGMLGPHELALGLSLIPGAVVGFGLSNYARNVLDAGYTRPGVLALSAFAALGVLIKHL